MKDSFDVTADIISLFNVPGINALLTGEIYADDRPNDSKLIDVVVNCLGITNTAMQRGSANINIHAPNLPSGGKDSITLRSIAKAIIPYVDTQFKNTFHTDIDDGGTIMRDSDGTWFYNIPVNYYSVQTNFKNI
jgi:hypothetical protein